MKQPHQLTTPQATDTPTVLSRRRLMGQAVLGGTAALVLSACWGGGSSDSYGDGTSAREAKLIAAYEKLEDGMVWTDVEALVGFPANDVRTESELAWIVGSVRLTASFTSTGSKLIVGADLKNGNAPLSYRNFNI